MNDRSWPIVNQMALKYEPGEVLLSGRDRKSIYEAVFIPLRPKSKIARMSAMFLC